MPEMSGKTQLQASKETIMDRPEMTNIVERNSILTVDTGHEIGYVTLDVLDKEDYSGEDRSLVCLSIISLDTAAMRKLRDHLTDILEYDRQIIEAHSTF